MKQLASTFAFTVLGLLPSRVPLRVPEEYPYTEHRYPSEWTNACFKSDQIVSDKTFQISCAFFKKFFLRLKDRRIGGDEVSGALRRIGIMRGNTDLRNGTLG